MIDYKIILKFINLYFFRARITLMQRINFSTLRFPNTDARTHIKLGGSKAGVYQALKSAWAQNLSLLEFLPDEPHFIGADDLADNGALENRISKLSSSSHPLFVRGCVLPDGDYPGDFGGAVDVIDSKVVRSNDDIKAQIMKMLATIKEDDFVSHMNWDAGSKITPKIAFQVVRHYNFPLLCSVIEHPSQYGIYILEASNANRDATNQVIYDVNNNSNVISVIGRITSLFFNERNSKKINTLMSAIKDSGIIPDGYTFQIEFGLDISGPGMKLFQVRLFRKKEERANFEISEGLASDLYHSFGITDEEGIVLPCSHFSQDGVKRLIRKAEAGYVFSQRGMNYSSPPLDVTPNNMKFFGIQTIGGTFCHHGGYRGLLKADVAMSLSSRNRKIPSSGNNIKVRSNGVQCGIEMA